MVILSLVKNICKTLPTGSISCNTKLSLTIKWLYLNQHQVVWRFILASFWKSFQAWFSFSQQILLQGKNCEYNYEFCLIFVPDSYIYLFMLCGRHRYGIIMVWNYLVISKAICESISSSYQVLNFLTIFFSLNEPLIQSRRLKAPYQQWLIMVVYLVNSMMIGKATKQT